MDRRTAAASIRITVADMVTWAVGVLSVCSLVGEGVESATEGNGFARYREAEVRVTVSSGGRSTEACLLGLQGGALELRPVTALVETERVYLPLADLREFKLEFLLPPDLREIRRSLAVEGTEGTVVDAFRPVVWPLVKYLPMPEDRFNIHALVSDYMTALICADRLDEAYAMVMDMPLSRLPADFVQHGLDLADKLATAGLHSRALTLLGLVPLREEDEALQALLMRYAATWRESESFDEALILYDRLRSLSGGTHRTESLLWTAYCNVRLGRVESARLFLRAAQPLASRDPAFSLHQMVLARIALREEKYREAVTEVSQGVVFSRVGDPWVPELLHLSALCYEALGSPNTAKNIHDQILLFFPANPWAERSRARLAAMDPSLTAGS